MQISLRNKFKPTHMTMFEIKICPIVSTICELIIQGLIKNRFNKKKTFFNVPTLELETIELNL